MKEAIQKAIEGGYEFKWPDLMLINPKNLQQSEVTRATPSSNDLLLDPLFWQALGKAMGWKNTCPSTYGCDGEMVKATGTGAVVFPLQCNKCGGYGYEGDHIAWIKNWHRFIDHLAEGKDVESFFKELLK